MTEGATIFVLSDIHYASEAEQARGVTEFQVIKNPLLRLFVRAYRHFIWRRDPFAHNHLLDRFLNETRGAELVVANGDYSCDTAFVGLSDDASRESARLCLDKLRSQFGQQIFFTLGDHELGKTSVFGGRGGLRLASWTRACEMALQPFWTLEIGSWLLVGVTSSLLALPVYEPETLPEEGEMWSELRAAHLSEIRGVFDSLSSSQRVLLFCHDPTALPFLWQEMAIRSKLDQVGQTIIGHLHSDLFLRQSQVLSGLPRISCLGNSVRRMSTALNEARHWQGFRPRLCPALAGIELLKDGGYLEIMLPQATSAAPNIRFRPLSGMGVRPG